MITINNYKERKSKQVNFKSLLPISATTRFCSASLRFGGNCFHKCIWKPTNKPRIAKNICNTYLTAHKPLIAKDALRLYENQPTRQKYTYSIENSLWRCDAVLWGLPINLPQVHENVLVFLSLTVSNSQKVGIDSSLQRHDTDLCMSSIFIHGCAKWIGASIKLARPKYCDYINSWYINSGILFPQLNHPSRPFSPPSGCFCRRFSNLRDQPLFSCNHCQNCQNHCQNCLNFGDWVLAKQLTITITHLNTIYYNFIFLVFINILIKKEAI